MAILEQQLETWSKQGPTAQFTATYDTIKEVLNDVASPYHARNYSIFLQGSYKNDTNVYGDSDVDVVIRIDDIYYTDLSNLSDEDKHRYNAARTNADYSVGQFKADVIAWLTKQYGTAVKPGGKAVHLVGNGSRRNADVLPCAKLRRYTRFKSWEDQHYDEGITFFDSAGRQIDNFPKQHSDNCTQKHQDTKSWFKPTVRIFKNLRNTLIDKGVIAADLAPSYFIEGLLWNVPMDRFGGTEQQNFADVLKWILEADRKPFTCANGFYYLCHPSSLVTWRAEKCQLFLAGAVDYWNRG